MFDTQEIKIIHYFISAAHHKFIHKFDGCVYEDDIKILFYFFNELNKIFDTEDKLNWYIQNQYTPKI